MNYLFTVDDSLIITMVQVSLDLRCSRISWMLILYFDFIHCCLPEIACHTPIPDPTRMADPNRVRARDCILGLIDLFFLRVELVPVVIQIIYVITKIIFIYKRTTTGVVSIKIYIHILSPIYLYMYIFFF